MDLTQIDLTDSNFLQQYVQGSGLSSFMEDTMKLIGDMGEGSGLDLAPLNSMIQSMSTMLPDKRLTLGELMSLNNEDDIIQSIHKVSLDIKHNTVLEELVTAGYTRAANHYCTTYSYTPSSEIAELAQEQVLPFFLEYIDHPRLTHNLNVLGSMALDVKNLLGQLDIDSNIMNMDIFNDFIGGKEIKADNIEEFLNLDPDQLAAEFLSKDEDTARVILSKFVSDNRLDLVKVVLDSGYPADKALDIAYEHGQDEIADYILSLLPEAELAPEISLDALGEDEE